MKSLQHLMIEKQVMVDSLKEIHKQIEQYQIVKDKDMNNLGFERIDIEVNKIMYAKETLAGILYIFTLFLDEPTVVQILREDQVNGHEFEFESLEEFVDLLNFINLY